MSKYPEIFSALASPFAAWEVKQRNQGGKTIHYITARVVMNRLDDVLGPENWWPEFTPHENSVECRLTIRVGDLVLTKADAGGYAGMADQGDDDKSGYSDALKRAAVMFGVGRYLYRDGVPEFAREAHGEVNEDAEPADRHAAAAAVHPSLRPAAELPRRDPGHAPAGNGNYGNAPRSGKALYAWCKKQEEQHRVNVVKYLDQWAKLQEFPYKMSEWDEDMVALAHAEAVRKLDSLQPAEAGGY